MDDTAVLLSSSVNRFDRWLANRMLVEMHNPPVNLALWNGEHISPGDKDQQVTLKFNNRRALLQTAMNPERNFGDLYVSGDLEVSRSSLLNLIRAVYHSVPVDGWPDSRRKSLLQRLLGYAPINDETRARENIHHHYDIGNDFYRLWLDDQMQYTCAYFAEKEPVEIVTDIIVM
ncbi:MAG: class I SAM-dependent methyltransferase, partial [Pseudomonadales bacterium]|nr:class I SAM-dependent methyltransferase [Pseudomonadales bacterium]